MNVLKRLYNAFTFNAMIILSGLCLFITAFIIVLDIRANNQLAELQENTLLEKCEKACYPSTVYSTKYNKCFCNASVVVKEMD